MSQTQTVIQRGDPAVEKFRLALIQDAKDAAAAGINTPLPAYQIAGLGQAELAALAAAQSSQGQFVPFLNQGSGAITAGQGLISQQGVQALQQGLQTTQGAQQFLNQAGQLANDTRNLPYQFQAAANQGLGQAVQLGTGIGQQGIGQISQAIQQGQNVAQGGMQNLSGFAGQASQLGLGAFENLMRSGQTSQLYGADAARAIRQAGQAGAPMTRAIQRQLGQLGIGAEGIAALTAQRAGALQAPLAQQLGQATAGAAGPHKQDKRALWTPLHARARQLPRRSNGSCKRATLGSKPQCRALVRCRAPQALLTLGLPQIL
jgi:hypothetical protein